MEKHFWQERWQRNQIGFHEPQVHSLLAAHWQTLGLAAQGTVFVPLCGKSLDMCWLRERGHQVLGVELSEIAIEAFLAGQGLDVQRSEDERFVRYRAGDYELLCGDFFDLSDADLRSVSAVYDRASLIALPEAMRRRYARHLLDILAPGVQILLIALEFSVPGFTSPPFALSHQEIERLFGSGCDIALLATAPTTVKGHAATESALHLRVR